MADQHTNIALLRKSNIPEWILVDEDWREFITFFKEYISASNVMTDEELIELDLLKRNNKKNPLSLNERMDKVAKKYNGIWSVKGENITMLEKVIEIHSQNEDLLDDLIQKTGASNLAAIEKSTSLKSEKSKLLSKEQPITDECLKTVEELQEVRLTNERKIGEIGQLYSRSVQNPLFMHQMPTADYFRQLEQFNDDAKHFIRKNFKVQNSTQNTAISADAKKQQEKDLVINDLRIVTDRLLNGYNKLHLSRMNFNAKTTLTNQFKIQNWSPSTLMGMRHEMLQMEHDNELNEVQKQHLKHKLKEQALQLSQLDVDALVYDSNQKRMKRAKQRLDYLTRFANLISEIMLLSEIFWVLVQLDMERMKCRNSYDSKLDTYRIDSLTCNRRIEVLHMIRKQSNDTFTHNYYRHLMEHLLVDQPNSEYLKVIDPIKCILSLDEFKSIISKVVQNVGENQSPTFGNANFFSKASSVEGLLRKYLYDGPVMKPQKSDEWYREKKVALERELKLIITRNELKKEECSHYIKKWSNDKFWRHLQVLWIWFMTEPKKVIKALKMIAAEAQIRSKNAAIMSRHTVGIVRKN